MEGKWGIQGHQTQEMKGKEGTGDPGGPDAKSGRYSSGSRLCPSGETAFFADGAKNRFLGGDVEGHDINLIRKP